MKLHRAANPVAAVAAFTVSSGAFLLDQPTVALTAAVVYVAAGFRTMLDAATTPPPTPAGSAAVTTLDGVAWTRR